MIRDPDLDSRFRGNDRKDFIQAVILAAGLGTRMGELTSRTPKPLLRYQGKPLLEHNLLALPQEIDEVIIVVGYLQEQIRAEIGDVFSGKKITYVEQREKKGTAHALSLCKDILHGKFLVLNGDDIYDTGDLRKLVREPLAMLVWKMSDKDLESKRDSGMVETNEEGNISGSKEGQALESGMLVNAGAYVINEDFFKYPMIAAGWPAEEFGLPQTFLQMARDGAKIVPVEAKSWHKIASSEDLK